MNGEGVWVGSSNSLIEPTRFNHRGLYQNRPNLADGASCTRRGGRHPAGRVGSDESTVINRVRFDSEILLHRPTPLHLFEYARVRLWEGGIRFRVYG
ncbi:MAG TPA: hypothetical protein VHS59_06105 [Bacillota bacterium]|nr:hypothetical protein [Bacillota bacterium]